MSDKYGPSNPPRLRKDGESVEHYRAAMGWADTKMMLNQDRTMKFDPATGDAKPYPSHAGQWRNYHGAMAWLFDPWSGRRRNAHDVGMDCYGLLVIPSGDALTAAQPGSMAEVPITCDCKTEISANGAKRTYCSSDQMRRAASDGSAFAGNLPNTGNERPSGSAR